MRCSGWLLVVVWATLLTCGVLSNIRADADECSSLHCHSNASCVNASGSFKCVCKEGFSGNGVECSDIDECAFNSHQCNISAKCFNTLGSYRCNCAAGFVRNDSLCQDVDECAENSHDCQTHASCFNTAGSYNCSCNHGYHGNGHNCTDVDECSPQIDKCHSNATCLNFPGSFNCSCKTGFTGNGSSCEDVDECLLGANSSLTGSDSNCTGIDAGCHQRTANCHRQAVCTNTLGSFVCTCKSGFTGNGSDCVDINECELGVDNCDIKSSCVNSYGSHSCICLPGYTGDGRECLDINECALGAYTCGENATCQNTLGSFKCECIKGFHGDGLECKPVHGCLSDLDCQTNAFCTKLNGTFVCQCQNGFFGDGYDCIAESSTPKTNEVSATHTPARQQSVIIGCVVGAVALFLVPVVVLAYRLKRKIKSKPLARHASTVMSQIDAIMLEEQTDRALDCVSVRSSRFSIPSLHLSTLTINWTIGRLCNSDQYYDKVKNDCVQCPPCPKGTESSTNCGHNENGEPTDKPQCDDCMLGVMYKDKDSTERCDNCALCSGGKKPKSACTRTSNTVCECPEGTYSDKYGVCRQISTKTPVTSPATTSIVTTTSQLSTQSEEPKHNGTQVKTPIVTTKTQLPTQSEESKHNETVEPSTTVSVKSSQPNNGPDAQQKDTRDRPFPQTGWIVLFCLLGFLIISASIFLSCHKRTRKVVSSFCCRKYCVLWPDHDSSDREVTYDLMRAEGHYEEQAATPTNNAEPIPPWNEPALHIVKSSSTPEQVCSCMTKDIDRDKIQCACTLTTSDPSIDQIVHTSSSAESVSDELQYYYKGMKQGTQTPTRKSSPSPSSSSGVFSSRSSDQCDPVSPRVTPTPPRGVSPDHCCAASTSASPSTGVTPHRWSPVHHCVTKSSPSTCETPHLPPGLSPECCCLTSSSASTSPVVTPRTQSPDLYCVTSSSNPSSTCVVPLRGRSPDPSIPSIQVQVSDEQEVSNQSNECSHIPISIEASDKKHDISKAKSSIASSPAAKNKRTDSKHAGKRNSLSPTKDPLCVCQREFHLKSRRPIDPNHCKETVEREKVALVPVPNGSKNTEFTVTASLGNDLKMEDEIEARKMKTNVTVYNQGGCMYRPINRDEGTEHRCPACCPLPSDSFFKLINRERQCLKEEICKQLNSKFRELAILGRVDSEMQEYEASSNPAERVLERLNASDPDLKLAEFEEMLHKIKRKDIVGVIYNHHLSCTLCQRNKFDKTA